MTKLQQGQPAPAFTLKDSANRPVALEDFRGRDVIVYFYPKAATPGCTTEACDFRDNLNSLKSAGYDVIGVSPDAPEAIAEFAADNSLNFPLLSDPNAETAKTWGAWGQKQINGQAVEGVLRSTVVLDREGVVRSAQYSVDANGHVASLREELGLG
jgi:thioredoxin-dependent peroxiredoxin